MSGNNKRKFSRIEFPQQANIYFQGKDYGECQIKDLNLTGMHVLGNFMQKAGDKCIVKYSRSSSTSNLYFTAAAKVVRSNSEGIGIVFTSMPLYSYMLLETTLVYESTDPLDVGHQLPDHFPFEIIDKLSENPDENI